MAMKLMKKAVMLTMAGTKSAPVTICLIHSFPPRRAYKDPPKKPLMGDVTAYMKMAVFRSDPRLKEREVDRFVKVHEPKSWYLDS